jgi:TIR domain
MSTVELRFGDMFDGPSDLIVLPCSTAGNITDFVREKLIHHQIPYPRPGMKLGDVQVLPFEGGENIAQFVAYAASVKQARGSTEEAIRRIGVQLGDYTTQNASIRNIAAPLLGAGAGGLSSEAAVLRLREGFRSTSHRDATLVVSVRWQDVFERIRSNLSSGLQVEEPDHPSKRPDKPPRVFVSYSHSSPEHKQWVEALGTFLRQNGIDARLDVWHLRIGMDLPQFMTNELTLADRVVLVSDERYAEKADGRVGGVGWETMIVQGDILRQPPESNKYLVVVRSPQIDDGLPQYLKAKFVLHWPGQDSETENRNRQLLLRELFDYVKVPVVGERPLSL